MSETRKRRPFFALFKLAVFFGILFAAARFLVAKKDEYAGLTEAEARAKMEATLSRFGDDKAAEIVDQVIPVMKDKGLLKTD